MLKLFRHKRTKLVDKPRPCNTQYVAVINDKWQWFNSKQELLTYLEEYSKTNTIYSLSMFRNEMYEVEKN